MKNAMRTFPCEIPVPSTGSVYCQDYLYNFDTKNQAIAIERLVYETLCQNLEDLS
jgi:hypothetical protein